MNRRGFIRSAIAAVAGVALAPLAKAIEPVKKLIKRKPTEAEILSILQADVDRIMREMQREVNQWMFSDGRNTLYKSLRSKEPIRIDGGEFLKTPPYRNIKSGIKQPPSL